MHNELKNYSPRKMSKFITLCILKKGGKKLEYIWPIANILKTPVNRNNLQVYNVRFLICLFKLSSIPLSRVIIIAILFLQWIFVPANIKNLDFQFVQKRNSLPPLYKVIQANKVNYAWLQTMDVCRCGHLRKQMWHIPRKEWNSINRS